MAAGSIFRSERMALCQMFVQSEAGYATVSELGELGAVQFRDLNVETSPFQRKFVQEVRRCNEMERRLGYIEAQAKKDDPNLSLLEGVTEVPKAPNPREILDLETQLEKVENEIIELSANELNLKSNYLELQELLHVLEKTQAFFSNETDHSEGDLGFISGVINRERLPAFEQMLWRVSRGNVLIRQAELDKPFEDPVTGHPLYKVAFVAFYQGEQLKSRVKKICVGFRASLYSCPTVYEERVEMAKGVRTRLEDLKSVLNQTMDYRHRILKSVLKDLPKWNIMVKKMKAVYHILNFFNVDVTKKCLIGECWIPELDLPQVQEALSKASAEASSTIPSFLNVIHTNEVPPTFYRTNKFTRGFQNLIDSYGIASYREVNPALYTIITFPFLFGVMFGDFGHGIILALFGGWMVLGEKKLGAKKSNNEIWNIFFGGRYIILLMGLFSMYTGLVYNDFFAKSVNIFGSNWRVNYNQSTIHDNPDLTLDPAGADLMDNVYPIGLDPVWQLAKNKIIFQNSFKMKLSIIFGVVHMIFGVCMSVVNYRYFKKSYNIFFDFLPQIIFLLLLFGYMVFMMIFKWFAYSAKHTEFTMKPGCAPSILIMFINMMLFKETTNFPNCNAYMFNGQNLLQMVFVVIALICIPWMLLAKPIFIMCQRTRHKRSQVADWESALNNANGGETPNGPAPTPTAGGEHNEMDEPMSEIFIHQCIHTIEYILSTISHTASYLRLWALSLAHAQLSEVLWGRILVMGFILPGYLSVVTIFIIFAVWAFFTIAILVMMEGLSAFLHTLRLHWVEFMSKFYIGLGYAFEPFSFKIILNEEVEETKS